MTGGELITAERQRQIDVEGWGETHDDAHDEGQLMQAAAAYRMTALREPVTACLRMWPWDSKWFKPFKPHTGLDSCAEVDKVRCLVKAGALVDAETDRLNRLRVTIAGEIDSLLPAPEPAASATPPLALPKTDEDIPF